MTESNRSIAARYAVAAMPDAVSSDVREHLLRWNEEIESLPEGENQQTEWTYWQEEYESAWSDVVNVPTPSGPATKIPLRPAIELAWYRAIHTLTERPCDPDRCTVEDPHTHHLTRFGRWYYGRGKI